MRRAHRDMVVEIGTVRLRSGATVGGAATLDRTYSSSYPEIPCGFLEAATNLTFLRTPVSYLLLQAQR